VDPCTAHGGQEEGYEALVGGQELRGEGVLVKALLRHWVPSELWDPELVAEAVVHQLEGSVCTCTRKGIYGGTHSKARA